MSVRIMIGREQGEPPYDGADRTAVLFDSVTGWALGPVFHGDHGISAAEQAEQFLDWVQTYDGRDLRKIPPAELRATYDYWLVTEKVR